jgi:hypothetical protein
MSICDLFLLRLRASQNDSGRRVVLRVSNQEKTSDLQFLKCLSAGGFSIPRPSQNREAMLPIIDHGIMLSSFYRNYRQRKNNPEVDSPMRVPRSIYNEAIPVQVPCVKDWKFMGGRDTITLNIDIALFKRSAESVSVAMSDCQIFNTRWQRSRLEKLTFTQNEIRHSLIMEMPRIFHLPRHEVPLFCEMRQQSIVQF